MISEGVKKYCKDDISLIENYKKAIADQNQIWDCHHRRETIVSKKELVENNEYFNRPAEELVFLTKSEHNALHNTLKFKGKHRSEETKKKIAVANKGKTPWIKGKHHNEETKRKMSESLKGKHHNDDHKQKIAESRKFGHWFNNGIKNVFVKECPEGFVKGMIKKSNLKSINNYL